jgi:hypothetical protein
MCVFWCTARLHFFVVSIFSKLVEKQGRGQKCGGFYLSRPSFWHHWHCAFQEGSTEAVVCAANVWLSVVLCTHSVVWQRRQNFMACVGEF